MAVISHESAIPEELSFQKGDRIEIVGYFLRCLPWFVGRHSPTGCIGFVQSCHVHPDAFKVTVSE